MDPPVEALAQAIMAYYNEHGTFEIQQTHVFLLNDISSLQCISQQPHGPIESETPNSPPVYRSKNACKHMSCKYRCFKCFPHNFCLKHRIYWPRCFRCKEEGLYQPVRGRPRVDMTASSTPGEARHCIHNKLRDECWSCDPYLKCRHHNLFLYDCLKCKNRPRGQRAAPKP